MENGKLNNNESQEMYKKKTGGSPPPNPPSMSEDMHIASLMMEDELAMGDGVIETRFQEMHEAQMKKHEERMENEKLKKRLEELKIQEQELKVQGMEMKIQEQRREAEEQEKRMRGLAVAEAANLLHRMASNFSKLDTFLDKATSVYKAMGNAYN